jgi:uncharacterized protein YecE (DUF72 family)
VSESNASESTALRIGTSAFQAKGWPGVFYPKGLPQREYLTYYAQHFDTVEIDSTLYGTPTLSTVQGWYAKTPKDFMFAVKAANTITHHKVLHDCQPETTEFLNVMDALGEKLGPILFQFAYFNNSVFPAVTDFLARLTPFLKSLPGDRKFAVEIRNKSWLVPEFIDTLRERGVALVMIDHPWMPTPAEWFKKIDPITADFTYVRFLGDRKGIETRTKIWNRVIVDRRAELSEWVGVLENVYKRKVPIYAYANNHYAGYSPATVEMFRDLWRRQAPGTARLNRAAKQGELFNSLP